MQLRKLHASPSEILSGKIYLQDLLVQQFPELLPHAPPNDIKQSHILDTYIYSFGNFKGMSVFRFFGVPASGVYRSLGCFSEGGPKEAYFFNLF